MRSTASLITSTANGNDRGARLGHLYDLIERAAGVSASGLPVVNHGEAQNIGVHNISRSPKHALLTIVDANGVSHAFVLDRACVIAFTDSLVALKHGIRPAPAPGAPITKPNGRLL